MWSETFIDQVNPYIQDKQVSRILFPEGDDPRVRKAAQIIIEKKLAHPVLYTRSEILGMETFWGPLWEDGTKKLQRAAQWLSEGKVDGVIAGAVYESSEVIRVGLKKLGLKPGRKRITGMFIMDTGLSHIGHNGVVIFADPIVIPNPTSHDYIEIIHGAYEIWRLIFPHIQPRAALLDFTSNSGQFEQMNELEMECLRTLCPELQMDGPLQVDAALVPVIAAEKAPNSQLLGEANLLIFPDLKSGNIGYKLVERLGGARAISALSGFNKTWNDLSRGCSWEDIVLVTCLSILQTNQIEVLDDLNKGGM